MFRTEIWKLMVILAKGLKEWLEDNGVPVVYHFHPHALWAYGEKAQTIHQAIYGEPLVGDYIIVMPHRMVMPDQRLRLILMAHECIHLYRHIKGWYKQENLWWEELLAYGFTMPLQALVCDWRFIFDLPRAYKWSVNLNID
jgi:hypothetical protein